MSFKVYDADQITMNIAGIPIDSGYADGEFCRIEQADDAFRAVVGTDGSVTRSKTNNRMATVTFILMQTSETNTALSILHSLDINAPNGAGVGPLLIKDNQGVALYAAAQSWIVKAPDVSYDRDPTPREWAVMCANLERLDGGN